MGGHIRRQGEREREMCIRCRGAQRLWPPAGPVAPVRCLAGGRPSQGAQLVRRHTGRGEREMQWRRRSWGGAIAARHAGPGSPTAGAHGRVQRGGRRRLVRHRGRDRQRRIGRGVRACGFSFFFFLFFFSVRRGGSRYFLRPGIVTGRWR